MYIDILSQNIRAGIYANPTQKRILREVILTADKLISDLFGNRPWSFCDDLSCNDILKQVATVGYVYADKTRTMQLCTVCLVPGRKGICGVEVFPYSPNDLRRGSEKAKMYLHVICDAYQGNPDAQYLVAEQYNKLLSTGGNFANLYKKKYDVWFAASYKGGSHAAFMRMGVCYLHGVSVKKDVARAIRCFRYAAETGTVDARMRLCEALLQNGSENAYAEAYGVLQALIRQKNTACAPLVWTLCDSAYLKATPEKQLQLIRDAAQAGALISDEERIRAALLLWNTHVEENKKTAFTLLMNVKTALAEQKDISLILAEGYDHGIADSPNVQKALYWYNVAAGFGDITAGFIVARQAFNNSGFEIKQLRFKNELTDNQQRMFFLLQRAYEANLPDADYYYAVCLLKGLGTEKDPDRAFQILNAIEDKTKFNIAGHLGNCYDFGWGTEKNPELSLFWYLKGAEQGDRVSANNAANYYWDGNGIAQDRAKAIELYETDTQQNQPDALYRLALWYAEEGDAQRDDEKAIIYLERLMRSNEFSAEGYELLDRMRKEGRYPLASFLNLFKTVQNKIPAEKAAELKEELTGSVNLQDATALSSLAEFLSASGSSEMVLVLLKRFLAEKEAGGFREDLPLPKGYFEAELSAFEKALSGKRNERSSLLYGWCYSEALSAEADHDYRRALFLHYCAAVLGCKKSLATIINMGAVCSQYFVSRTPVEEYLARYENI